MKIAVLTYNLFPVGVSPKVLPLGRVGAIERVVGHISDGLVERGHDVTLFAAGDSQTRANLVGIPDKATFHHDLFKDSHSAKIDAEYFLLSEAALHINRKQYDIVHSHMHIRSALWSPFISVPMVSTIHTTSTQTDNFFLEPYKDKVYYVSISDAQRKLSPKLRYIKTIYHGINVNDFTYNEKGGDYCMFMGRIAKEKGLHSAIKAVTMLDKSFIIAGTLREDYTEQFNRDVLPFIDNKQVKHVGILEQKEIDSYLGNAKAFLFPIEWEEPFGLVIVEAMACGTPVIAYARGSVPEIVKDGETGYIVNFSGSDIRGNWITKKTGREGLSDAIERLYNLAPEEYMIMRRNARLRVEKYFSFERMISQYESVFNEVIGRSV